MTGSTAPHQSLPGHQTSGCDAENRLDAANDPGNGNDPTTGLLQGHNGGDTDRSGSISAGSEAQWGASEKPRFAGIRRPGTGVRLLPCVSLLISVPYLTAWHLFI